MKARRYTRRVLPSLVIAGALLAITSCSGDGSPDAKGGSSATDGGRSQSVPSPTLAPPRSPPQWPVLASAKGGKLRVEVNRIRSDSHGFTMVHWTLTNISDHRVVLPDALGGRRDYNAKWYWGHNLAGVELISRDTGNIYLPLTDPNGNCVCNYWTGIHQNGFLASGNYIRGYTAYFIPPDLRNIGVSFPGFELLKNIPISRPRAANGN